MDSYILHARERELIYYLSSRHGIVTAKELSGKLSISERTIRTEIARINQTLKSGGIFIRSVYGKGYLLEIGNRELFQRLFSNEANIQTKEDRIRYLILKLARSRGRCNMEDLEEDIYISRTTLENDLREVRERISQRPPFLKLKRTGNEIEVEQSELKRRNVLIRLYCRDWDYDSRNGITLKDSAMNHEILGKIRVELKNVLEEYQIDLDDFGLVYMTMTLAVCYERILEGYLLVLPEGWKEEMPESQREVCSLCADKLIRRMGEAWDLEIEEDVRRWMGVLLYQLRLLSIRRVGREEAIRMTMPESQEMEDRLLDEIEARYMVSLREDEAFCTNLLLHIQALKSGMLPLQTQSRYALDNMRQEYPYLGEIAHFMCRHLEKMCETRMDIDEENYLLPLLALAQFGWLKKQRSSRMRLALVSHYSSWLTHYLMDQLERNYGSRVQLDGPFPVYDRNRMDEAKPACILTTVQMDIFRSFSVPVITVSARLTRNEQDKIEHQIRKMEDECLYLPLPGERSHYFRSDLSLEFHRKAGEKEILQAMRQRLMEEEFSMKPVASLGDADYYTVLEGGMVFLYVIGSSDQPSVFSMAYLDHGIVAGNQKGLRRILLLLLNPQDRKYLGSFYRLAGEIAEHAP